MNVGLLSEICRVPGAPGYEQRIRERIIAELDGIVDSVEIDNMGNVIALKKGRSSEKKVVVAAHMDEISFMVTDVDKDGFIRFCPLGGYDPKTLTAQRVIVHGKEDVLGVMGAKPIHVLSPEERSKAPKLTDFFIDTGLPVEKVKDIVQVGDVITRERELVELGDCMNGKSLDNRVSVFILLEAIRDLGVPAYDTYAAFTVQEEVGIRGARAVGSYIKPDFGINLDVTMAYDLPGANDYEKVSSLGQGTAVKVLDGMTICDYRMVRFMESVAKKHKIKYQREILPAGGTDTAGIQRHGGGSSIAGGISIPTRYLHQVIEMVHKEDVQGTIDLLSACLDEMDSYDWSFR